MESNGGDSPKRLKRSHQDPFLYLGVISAILLGILVFIFTLFPSSLPNQKSSSFQDSSGHNPAVSFANKSLTEFLGPTDSLPESPELSLIQKSSLIGFAPPVTVTPKVLGAIIGETEPEPKKEIIEYAVQPGDNLWLIVERFNISLDTLLWANNLNKNSTLKVGQRLVILPISGVVHHIRAGDTLSEIAKKYKAEIKEIVSFNELSGEGDIYIGDILIIPQGIMPPPAKRDIPSLIPLASSYFICPIASPCKITQGLHWYNAVDLSHGKCGEPIYAVAGGKVLKAKYGWNNGAGNYLTISHPNGIVTTYGHLAASLVSPGEEVSQGQLVAYVGGRPGTPGAGQSTGCHLHFGVSGAKNPFAP